MSMSKASEKLASSWRDRLLVAGAITSTIASVIFTIDYFARHLILGWRW